MILLKPGASFELQARDAYRLFFVIDGSGAFDGNPLGRHFGASLDPGERATLRATSELTLLAFTLPLIGADWQEPETPSEEPVPDESVAVPA
jgi:redox-sensitive bicupin YhaK (pirin superfamily)